MNSTTMKVINASKRHWLNLEISSQFQKLSSVELELYDLHLSITKDITCNYEHDKWMIFGTKLYENISESVKKKNENLHKKFLSLMSANNTTKRHKPLQVDNFVQNLSSEQFSDSELELLNFGLKFAVKPIYDPLVDVVVDIETALKYKSESVKYHTISGITHIQTMLKIFI